MIKLALHSIHGREPDTTAGLCVSEPQPGESIQDWWVRVLERLVTCAEDQHISDLQVRSGSYMFVNTKAGAEALEAYGRPTESDVRALLSILWGSRRRRDRTEDPLELLKKGSLDFGCEGHDVQQLRSGRMRVQAFKHAGGLGLTCRLLKNQVADLNALFIPPDVTELLKRLVSKKQGLGIVSGPTGSGKSTTLAALVEWARLNTHSHIVTIEDPIEYFYPDSMVKDGHSVPSSSLVTQQEVGDHVSSYAAGLKEALRKKPDIILVGEVRDAATMQTVFDAAQTGHLVLTTMHTRGAVKTLLRILELFPREDGEAILSRLADILLFVMSQGLLPCRVDDSNRLGIEFFANTTPETQSCIRAYKTQANQLEDALARPPNIQWTTYLDSMRKEGIISEETCNEYTSLGR